MGRRNNKKRLGYASGEIPTGPGQTQGQTGGNNRGGFDQRNVYRPQQQHGRPPYPRPGFPNPQQQPQSTPPLGPRTIDSGWRGATAAAVPPSNPPQMTSTFQNQQNFNSNFRPRPPPQQIHQQQQQQQNHRTQPQHQYQHHPHNQPRPFNQASSYYPSGPSRAPASRSNNNSSSSSRLDDLNYNSGVGSTNGGHSNGSYQDHSRRTLDSTLDADYQSRTRQDSVVTSVDSPNRRDVKESTSRTSRADSPRRTASPRRGDSLRRDSPRRDAHDDRDSRSSAGSVKGKERDRGNQQDSRFREDSRKPTNFAEIDKERGRQFMLESSSHIPAWKKEPGSSSPPRRGSSHSNSKNDRPGRSRRKRSRSVSDISASPRSPDDRRRRKRSSSRSRERDTGSLDHGSGRARDRRQDNGRDRGGGSWRDRRDDGGRNRSRSPPPSRPKSMGKDRDRYQVRDDIEKARAQVRERDAAAEREKKEKQRVQRLKEEETRREAEQEKALFTHRENASLSPEHQPPGRVLSRKDRSATSKTTSANGQNSTLSISASRSGSSGWTTIREGSKDGEDTPMKDVAIQDPQDSATNGFHQDAPMNSASDAREIAKEEAPSSAMLAAIATAEIAAAAQGSNLPVDEPQPNQSDLQAASTVPYTPPRSPARALAKEGYEIMAQVGEGTYGKVFKARAESSGTLVALKKLRMEKEKDGFPITALREIKLLQSLKHENVVRLHEMMVSKGEFYMVFDYLEHDLSGVLNHPSLRFAPQHLKSLSHQLLSALSYLHKKSVLHRDLKCSNILLDNFGRLKIADFGLARVYAKRRKEDYTNRVCTSWYRPPELLFGATVYGPEIDMWGAGCIFVELFSRRAIFPGSDDLHQIQVVTDVLGPVTSDRWPEAESLPWFELVKAPGSGGAAVEKKEQKEADVATGEKETVENESGSKSRSTSPVKGTTEETKEMAGDETELESEEKPKVQVSPVDVPLEEKEEKIFRKAFGRYKLTPAALAVAQALLTYDPQRRSSAKEALEMDYFITELPVAERPAGILSSAGGEWHEFESRIHKKSRKATTAASSSTSRKH